MDTAEFADLFAEFLRTVNQSRRAVPSPFAERLRRHLGTDPAGLAAVAHKLPPHDQPNLQLALQAWARPDGRTVELIGIAGQGRRHRGLTLGELVQPLDGGLHAGPALRPGPVDYVSRPVGVGQALACVDFGLVLARQDGRPVVAFIAGPAPHTPESMLLVEAMAPERDDAEAFLAELAALRGEHDVYRCKVLTLGNPHGPFHRDAAEVEFIDLPRIDRDEVILPAGTLELIEEHTIGVSQRAAALRAGGRHLKRGLLLYGPPGTGKTHTLTYLIGRMAERTAIVLSGQAFGAIAPAAEMARRLAPSLLVLEDVDLVAQERGLGPQGTNPLLFQLLNEMDGVGADADVIFALTTNRVDLLEPALAARPGRVDLAVEIPLPDDEGRRRLLATYARGLEVAEDVEWAGIVERTGGVTASFIRELLRRAALHAAGTDGAPPTVDAAALNRTLSDLLERGGELGRRLLGGTPNAPA